MNHCHISTQVDQHASEQGEKDRIEAENEKATGELFEEANNAIFDAANNARKCLSDYRTITVSSSLFAALTVFIQEMPEAFDAAALAAIERNRANQ